MDPNLFDYSSFKVLGEGGTSYVLLGKYDEKERIVKILKLGPDGNPISADREYAISEALGTIQDVAGIHFGQNVASGILPKGIPATLLDALEGGGREDIVQALSDMSKSKVNVIIQEVAGAESLSAYVGTSEKVGTLDLLRMLFQMMWALYAANSRLGFVHVDIKMANIQITENNGAKNVFYCISTGVDDQVDCFRLPFGEQDPIICFIDFGSSFFQTGFNGTLSALESVLEFPETTLVYNSPEYDTVIRSDVFSHNTDIWASAMCLIAIICHKRLKLNGEEFNMLDSPDLPFLMYPPKDFPTDDGEGDDLQLPPFMPQNKDDEDRRPSFVRILRAMEGMELKDEVPANVQKEYYNNPQYSHLFGVNNPFIGSLRAALVEGVGENGFLLLQDMLRWNPVKRSEFGIPNSNYATNNGLFHPFFFLNTTFYLGKQKIGSLPGYKKGTDIVYHYKGGHETPLVFQTDRVQTDRVQTDRVQTQVHLLLKKIGSSLPIPTYSDVKPTKVSKKKRTTSKSSSSSSKFGSASGFAKLSLADMQAFTKDDLANIPPEYITKALDIPRIVILEGKFGIKKPTGNKEDRIMALRKAITLFQAKGSAGPPPPSSTPSGPPPPSGPTSNPKAPDDGQTEDASDNGQSSNRAVIPDQAGTVFRNDSQLTELFGRKGSDETAQHPIKPALTSTTQYGIMHKLYFQKLFADDPASMTKKGLTFVKYVDASTDFVIDTVKWNAEVIAPLKSILDSGKIRFSDGVSYDLPIDDFLPIATQVGLLDESTRKVPLWCAGNTQKIGALLPPLGKDNRNWGKNQCTVAKAWGEALCLLIYMMKPNYKSSKGYTENLKAFDVTVGTIKGLLTNENKGRDALILDTIIVDTKVKYEIWDRAEKYVKDVPLVADAYNNLELFNRTLEPVFSEGVNAMLASFERQEFNRRIVLLEQLLDRLESGVGSFSVDEHIDFVTPFQTPWRANAGQVYEI